MSASPEAHAPQTSGRPELAAVRGPVTWSQVGAYEDIRLEVSEDGIAKVTICRPEVRNAFRPQTLIEISDALVIAREDPQIGVIILTGEGPDAFCSGGDQRVRGDTGYLTDPGSRARSAGSTSPICRSRSAGCPSRSWPWSPGMPSAAGTCST